MRAVFVRNAELVSRRSRSSLVVHLGGGRFKEINVRDIEALVVIGSKVKVESGVINLLSRFNIPVAIVSKIGVSTLSTPVITLTNEARCSQYSLPEGERLEIAYGILKAKFGGFRNILLYHDSEPPEFAFEDQASPTDLVRWEANNSKLYWQKLLRLLPEEVLAELRERYGFRGRKPRSRDPFNQSISLLYALLYSISTRALLAAGLDPTYGLLHRTRYSTPLVYDYVEMYKPLAVHAVIKVYRVSKKPIELGEDGYLTKESTNTLCREFFNIAKARIRNTKQTPHRTMYINAYRLAQRIKGQKTVQYTYTYNPKKLIYT